MGPPGLNAMQVLITGAARRRDATPSCAARHFGPGSPAAATAPLLPPLTSAGLCFSCISKVGARDCIHDVNKNVDRYPSRNSGVNETNQLTLAAGH
jgi:hypothetical protein